MSLSKADARIKVVTQFLQFLSDNCAGDTVIYQSNVIDEEEIELALTL